MSAEIIRQTSDLWQFVLTNADVWEKISHISELEVNMTKQF